MKSIATDAKAALANGTAIVVGAIKIEGETTIRLWGGPGPINLPGEAEPFLPLGDRGLVQAAGGALGGAAQAITLTVSGIEPDALDVDDTDTVKGAPTTLWRLIFAGDGITLLDVSIWSRGRLDEVIREDQVGGTSMISASLETAARGLGRSGARMRSDADQRLVKANDGFFRNVSFAGEKTLYWGGRKPENAGDALGGSYGGAYAGSGGGGGGGGRDGGRQYER